MKRKCKVSRRFGVKIQIFALVLVIFSLIHLRYIFSIDRENLEREYTMPDNLMKFPIKTNVTELVKREILEPSLSDFTCEPRRGVVFLKTHKTGSTTMNNIFLRYAEKHKLSVGLPPPRKWELAGYPALFKKVLIDPQLKQYQLLCHHFRMDMKAVSSIVPKDAVYITILRDPANSFESGFSFFRDGPYSAWMPDYETQGALKKFLDNPLKYYNKSTPWYFRAKNYQSFDLGFQHEREDDSYIETVLHTMDNLYDLVMITERFEESLILLKDLLCLASLEDLVYIRLKVRQNSLRRDSDDDMNKKMRKWNLLDSKIYDYYLERLDRKVFDYGMERMDSEVEELRSLLDKTEKECVSEYDHEDLRPWISRIRLNKDASELCKKLSWGEVKFGDHIRVVQRKYVAIPEENQINPDALKRMLEAEQKLALNLK